MSQKPSIPKGTRDFGPEEMNRRNYIFRTITDVYKKFGFKQIETPAMENLSTLLGKYGEEGDKLLFKILNSGDYLSKTDSETLAQTDSIKLTPIISEKGLRYDLTVPFARFVVQHQNEIVFPFKRYQIQPVWRADRPQKGRYREFYQCDSDVIGSESLLNEAELVQIIDEVFQKLGIEVIIKINNRKILAGLAETMQASDKIVELTIALDKIDKIGIENVMEEVKQLGITDESLVILQKLNSFSTFTNDEKLNLLTMLIGESTDGLNGISETKKMMELIESLNITNKISIDLTLARGLNYYTGAIFEVVAKDVKMGSICGGGRYDDLTGIFGLTNMSGVGVSFGADRIYDVLAELNLFPQTLASGTKVLVLNFGDNEMLTGLKIANLLRNQHIATEIYPDNAKLKKQMNYADRNKIEYVIMAGEEEIKNQLFVLKNMITGQQDNYSLEQLVEFLK